jgi:menaquinone-dependent protoporphyrinogen oxidase
MRVVIATGSRHGSTRDIGDRLAGVLTSMGIDAESCDVAEVKSLEGVDAVVLGSAVYMGQWTKEAQVFVDHFRAELLVMPTWVFSSGPVGDPPQPDGEPAAHSRVREAVEAEDDRVFPGALDRDALGLGEKLIVKMIGAPDGDFRPWDEIDAYAREIGQTLMTHHAGQERPEE